MADISCNSKLQNGLKRKLDQSKNLRKSWNSIQSRFTKEKKSIASSSFEKNYPLRYSATFLEFSLHDEDKEISMLE